MYDRACVYRKFESQTLDYIWNGANITSLGFNSDVNLTKLMHAN